MVLPAVLLQTQEKVAMPSVGLCRSSAYMARSVPWSSARKGCPSAAAAEPQFPKELIPVAGGGGAEGRSPRRRKGREVSAAIPAREVSAGTHGAGEKGQPPKPGAVPREGCRGEEAGQDG